MGRRMLAVEMPGRRKRGGPKRRWLQVVEEDAKEVGAMVKDVEDRARWRCLVRCSGPE